MVWSCKEISFDADNFIVKNDFFKNLPIDRILNTAKLYLKFEKKGFEPDIHFVQNLIICKKTIYEKIQGLFSQEMIQVIETEDIEDSSKKYVTLNSLKNEKQHTEFRGRIVSESVFKALQNIGIFGVLFEYIGEYEIDMSRIHTRPPLEPFNPMHYNATRTFETRSTTALAIRRYAKAFLCALPLTQERQKQIEDCFPIDFLKTINKKVFWNNTAINFFESINQSLVAYLQAHPEDKTIVEKYWIECGLTDLSSMPKSSPTKLELETDTTYQFVKGYLSIVNPLEFEDGSGESLLGYLNNSVEKSYAFFTWDVVLCYTLIAAKIIGPLHQKVDSIDAQLIEHGFPSLTNQINENRFFKGVSLMEKPSTFYMP